MQRILWVCPLLLLVAPATQAAELLHFALQDDGTGTIVDNTAGSDGTLLGAANTSDVSDTGPGGVYLKAFHLDGTDDCVSITSPGTITGALTFSAWGKSDTGANLSVNFVGYTSNANYLQLTSAGFRSWLNTTITDFAFSAMGTVWHHYFLTRDASNNVRVWRDGVESTDGAKVNSAGLTITRLGNAQNQFYWTDGSLCGLRFWNEDLSADVLDYFDAGKPQSSVAPSITGTVEIGETLTANASTWSDGSGANQWRKATDGSGTGAADIGGETGGTYTVDAGDVAVGEYVGVRVTQTNSIGSTTADSPWYEVVGGAAGSSLYLFQPIVVQ